MRRAANLVTLASLASLAVGLPIAAATEHARNVVLMVADGAGYNTWEASAMYQGITGEEPYRGPGWVERAVSTHALRQARDPGDLDPLAQDPTVVYDPALAWGDTPIDGRIDEYPLCFTGYRWLRRAPDSANTATAMATGVRTYVGAINMDGAERPIRDTVVRIAKETGRRVGIVTSVQLSHATPAAIGGAHSPSRKRYCSIATQLLTSPDLDLIAGCGHPEYDNNGQPIEDPAERDYRYVGGRAVWEIVRGISAEGRVCGDPGEEARELTADEIDALRRWTLVDAREDIEALAGGPTPEHLLIVPRAGQRSFWRGWDDDRQVGATLQQERGSLADPRYTPPGYDPLNEGVPTLETLTRVALNALDDDPDGFFLHVEGGAVDWAMHSNQMGRMIEEMLDFERSLAAVAEWVEAHDAWSETLVIVTADHDHLLFGPEALTDAFDELEDRGPGRVPGYRWLGDSHSNLLVPLFARGPGAEHLEQAAVRRDPFLGPYLDQPAIFSVMHEMLVGTPVAIPKQ